jgi:hypothetical protein
MDAFIARLQELAHPRRSSRDGATRPRALHIADTAHGIGVNRNTLAAWINEQWKPPLDGAQRLVSHIGDPHLSRAFLQYTGLRILPPLPRLPSMSLLALIDSHMSLYESLAQLAVKIRQGTATAADRARGRELLDEIRQVTDEIESQLQEPSPPTDGDGKG